MISCLACTNTNTNTRQTLHAHEALHLLDESRTPKHLKQVHAQILRNGLAHNPTLLTKLIRLYASHRQIHHASLLFSHFPNNNNHPPTFAWNLMIRAHSSPSSAILLYNRMLLLGVPPDKFTFPFVIKACSTCSHLKKGKEVHAYAIKTGFYKDPFVHNTLIHLYLACGDLVFARKVFDKMRVRNVVSWTTLVSGLVACGQLETARDLFEVMPVRNVVTWTAMIDGCARNGRPDEAFELFRRMQVDCVKPNEFTLVGLLIACTELGSLSLGRWVHDFAHKNGGLERGVYVGTALVDMYSKCGSLEDAVRVFDQMPERSLATWNSMITSLGVHGLGWKAVALFREMEMANVRPDRITFVGVLCACVRAGMVDEGCRLFRSMREHYNIVPGLEHYSSMVELLGSVDLLDKASELVKNLKMELDVDVLRMLLRSCRARGYVELEKVVYECIHQLEVSNGSIGLGEQEYRRFEWEVG